ncbi:MAG: MBL fold metallo-hydrolase [Rheinheimera sp.]|uniref:MBL fold metallo-hydrolase n=1 Tax=Arsukibacterium sp. UBA3155 TaxID=1946058 RepID=UPI000C8C88BF|nr:MBL fold metallo-hydrolase [Arsukibacterium sp. UBA3155]MAD77675.1 MBL fold metallo-hydrolase [Rheinheimera sp.]
MNKLTCNAVAALLLFAATYLYSPQTLAASENKLINKLSDQAYVLRFSNSWTNIGLINTDQGVVLIDPAAGSANLEQLRQFVADTFPHATCFVLNTHGHPDHTSGNDYFQSKGCALIDNVDNFDELQALRFSSHTSNDQVFYHKQSNSIFVGDIYETRGKAIPSFWSGGLAGFNLAVAGIEALGDSSAVVIPGHGEPASKEELALFRKNTAAWVARVKALNDDNMAASDISKDEQIRSIYENFNVNNVQPYVAEQALIRFIERTLHTLAQ